jgi:hypothetical protein
MIERVRWISTISSPDIYCGQKCTGLSFFALPKNETYFDIELSTAKKAAFLKAAQVTPSIT